MSEQWRVALAWRAVWLFFNGPDSEGSGYQTEADCDVID